MAGHDGKSVTFFLTEAESAQEWVLERINNLLTVGDIPHLFTAEEMEPMFADLVDLYHKHEYEPLHTHPYQRVMCGWDGSTLLIAMLVCRPQDTDTPSYETMYKFFCNQVRSNLHVVLCYTPDGDKLRSRSWRYACSGDLKSGSIARAC